MDFKLKLKECGVVTVAVLDSIDDALALGEILEESGLNILEITMRTPAAIDCIKAAVKKFPKLTVGAGSVAGTSSLRQARDAGASFAVSAGLDMEIVEEAANLGIPFVPGAATPSELMAALKLCKIIKIFPAALLGGPAYINAISSPFASFEFHLMPTGGVTAENLAAYMKTERVIACGMSWLAERGLIAAKNFNAVAERAASVVSILKAHGL
ncbi:MAG: bifunctional 4-hydroxy-2-oxoglutarate aldolase/2-dehydro-3-deoxy-phosphogluconate aldolase [Leptospirales bacterium]|nr:bifunctional 4-hydroxy-2-oxoglutarate aldolase/2-dehydro-3-deoxy-phosphogluconate aldolase [Leptospirales bacterium]